MASPRALAREAGDGRQYCLRVRSLSPSRTCSSDSAGAWGAQFQTSRSWRTLPAARVYQRIVEIEAEEPGVLSDHRRRDYIEDVIVGLLRDLLAILRDQPPVVALARIGRHLLHQRQHPLLAPVVAGHHQQARRLCVGGVQVLQIVGRGLGGEFETLALVGRVGTAEVRQRANPESILY